MVAYDFHCGSSLGIYDDEYEGADGGSAEQQRPILIDFSGLNRTKSASGTLGNTARTIHCAVDHALIDVAIHPTSNSLCCCACSINDAIKNFLVEPIHSGCNRVRNLTNNDFFVQHIEVVLVDKKFVTKAQDFVALGETNKLLVLLCVQLNAHKQAEKEASEHNQH